jgi:hypothetical protein
MNITNTKKKKGRKEGKKENGRANNTQFKLENENLK